MNRTLIRIISTVKLSTSIVSIHSNRFLFQSISKRRMASNTNSAATAFAVTASTASASESHRIKSFPFGPYHLDGRQIFAISKYSYASVNLKPVVDGHVLVISNRIVDRVKDLTESELADLWLLAQRISIVFELNFPVNSFTFAIQDGILSGQTVPHIHIHICPRRPGDFKPNDLIYRALDKNEGIESKVLKQSEQSTTVIVNNTDSDNITDEMQNPSTVIDGVITVTAPHMDEPESRKPRSIQSMAAEAAKYRQWIAAKYPELVQNL